MRGAGLATAALAPAVPATGFAFLEIGFSRAGLDISGHGMYGYPEQFIPAPELVGNAPAPGSRDDPRPAITTTEVPAS